MEHLTTNPAFAAYVVAAVVLCLNILGLWLYSGAVRARSRTTRNPEDIATVLKGAVAVETDPPEVARVLRVHRNAADNIMPFLVLGFLYVLLGASQTAALGFFGVFTAARLVHSFVYLAGLQPWRTLSFAVSDLATLVMTGDIVRRLLV